MTLDFERYLLPSGSPGRSSSCAEECREFRELLSFAPGFPVPQDTGYCMTLPLQCGRVQPNISSLSSKVFTKSYSQSDLLTTSVFCSNVFTDSAFCKSPPKMKDVQRNGAISPQKTEKLRQINSYNSLLRTQSSESQRLQPSIKQSACRKLRRRSSVRFADDCGENLVTFIMIPSVTRHSSPFNDDRAPARIAKTFSCEENSRAVDFYQKLSCTDSAKSDLNNNSHDTPNANVPRPQLVYRCDVDFCQPAACFASFLQKLDRLNVALENAKVTDDARSSLTCSIKVKNLSPVKRVFARCTHDNWKSYIDLDAGFVSAGYESSLYDTFSFCLQRPAAATGSSRSVVEFAVCYQVAGQEFWDNNENKNFSVSWSSVESST